jgi:hypothetical protein
MLVRMSDDLTQPDSSAFTRCQTVLSEIKDACSFALLFDFFVCFDAVVPAAIFIPLRFKISIKCSVGVLEAASNLYAHDFCFHHLYL